MIVTMSDIRKFMNNDPKIEGRVDIIRKGVIADFEKQTDMTWTKETGRTLFVEFEEWIHRDNSIFLNTINLDKLTIAIKTWGKNTKEADATVLTIDDDYTVEEYRKYRGVEIRPLLKLCQYTRITFDSGFDVLPDDLQDIHLAMIKQIEFLCMRLSSEKLIQKNQGFEGGSTTYEEANFHPLYRDTIEFYRNKCVA